MKILQNAVVIPNSNRILVSENKEQKVQYDGVIISGGKFYLNREGSPEFTELSITEDHSIKFLVNNLVWGTYGEVPYSQRTPENFRYVRLSEMNSEHLERIHRLKECKSLHKWVIEQILTERRYWPKRLKNSKSSKHVHERR